jgi:hypothetical protein
MVKKLYKSLKENHYGKIYQKTIIASTVTIFTILIAALIAYLLYNHLIDDATRRIKRGVSQGVSEGIGDAVNPMNIPRKLFGGESKK